MAAVVQEICPYKGLGQRMRCRTGHTYSWGLPGHTFSQPTCHGIPGAGNRQEAQLHMQPQLLDLKRLRSSSGTQIRIAQR